MRARNMEYSFARSWTELIGAIITIPLLIAVGLIIGATLFIAMIVMLPIFTGLVGILLIEKTWTWIKR